MVWVTEHQPTPAELAACVQCGLCLPHCPTFRLTGDEVASPRGRLAAMNAVADGILPLDGDFEEAMTFCLNCRACEAICPSMVPYGRAMEGVRAELAVQRPSLSRRWRHLLLGRVLAWRRMMIAATAAARVLQRTGAGRWLPSRLRRPWQGMRRLAPRSPLTGRTFEPARQPLATVGLLAGCVMEPWFAGVNRAAVELLTLAGFRVVVPSDQTCCGALAAHDGAAPAAARLAAINAAAFAGVDLVVADAAGCSAHLKEYHHWTGRALPPVRDVTEVVAEAITGGRLPVLAPGRGPVAVQDPCHLRHAQRVTTAPRVIVGAAGYQVVEIDPDGLCCGAAGIYSLLRPGAAAELGRRKADQIRSSGTTVVASANPGCEMQLRAHLDGSYRILHPVELYAEAVAR
jgi:glycolate oxidase iron-sulfur subunit